MRCLSATRLSSLGAAAGILYLCLERAQPAAVTVPVLLAVVSLLCAAASAALFAHISRLHLEIPDQDADDDGGGGPGRGPDKPPTPPGGGDIGFDWERFEREFRSYCERVPVAAR